MSQQLFAGTGFVTKLIIRHNRFKVLVWLIGFITITLATALAYPDIYPDEQSRAAFAFTMENPAMVAMLGVGYTDYETIGALFAHEMLLFTAIAVAIMNILLVGRSTRADEEDGRVELIRSLPVGRLAYLNGTVIFIVVTNMLLAVFIGIGISLLQIDGMNMQGAFLYGAILGAAGLVFASFTALFAQLAETSRGSTMLSFATLIAAYLIRASGDVSREAISLISPLGWVVRTEAFVENKWWPVYVMLVVSVVIILLAFCLNAIRDLEAGFISARAGKRNASAFLQTNLGLALRLQRTNLIAWAIGVFLLGASFGAILGDLEMYYTDNEFVQAFLGESEESSIMEQFIVMLMAIMALISTIPAVMTVLKLKSEENKQLTENYFSRAVPRTHLLGNYIVLSIMISIVMQGLVALGLWSVGTFVLEKSLAIATLLSAALVYMPAIWIVMGIAVCLLGIAPKRTSLVWLYIVFSFVVLYLGGLLEFPAWLNNFSVFNHISQIPVEDFDVLRALMLVMIALILIMLGLFGYNRRDIEG